MLVTAVLMGTASPASILLQGVVFSAVTLGWIVVRVERDGNVGLSGWTAGRTAAMVATLVVVSTGGAWLGPRLPWADANDRFILRDDVIPPFDPLLEPSPLAGFRRYTDVLNKETTVLIVSTNAPNERIRLATMDRYDDLVWKSSGDGTPIGGTFVRIGSEVPGADQGTVVSAEIEIAKPHGVWLPTMGDVTSIEILDGNSTTEEWLRFNLETESAAVATGVPAGLRYRVEAVSRTLPSDAALGRLGLDPRYAAPDPSLVPASIRTLAEELVGNETTPYGKLTAIAAALREQGKYSDGGEGVLPATPPGHSISRLQRFLAGVEWVGNGEQYAATLALMARAQSIPVRVVMGFSVPAGDGPVRVRGEDVEAWVEVPLADVGWVPVSATPSTDNTPEQNPEPRDVVINPEPQPPPASVPPPPAQPPTALGIEDPTPPESEAEQEPESGAGSSIPLAVILVAPPLALMIGPIVVILLWKLLRRHRRRRGHPARRLVGAWNEVIDQSRDLRRPVPVSLTRTEAARLLGSDRAAELGTRTDVMLFGLDEPTHENATEVWGLADEVRHEIRHQHGLVSRVRASLSPASLRRHDVRITRATR